MGAVEEGGGGASPSRIGLLAADSLAEAGATRDPFPAGPHLVEGVYEEPGGDTDPNTGPRAGLLSSSLMLRSLSFCVTKFWRMPTTCGFCSREASSPV